VPGSNPALCFSPAFFGRFSPSMSCFSPLFRRWSDAGGADATRLWIDRKHYPLAGLTNVNNKARLYLSCIVHKR
jgi:hypothetical protein